MIDTFLDSFLFFDRYQIRWAILQAGDYGAPQSRRRLIYFGARVGLTLPNLPLPSHFFHERPQNMQLPTMGFAPIALRKKECAPHPEVTVRDAIGDLPPFEWCVALLMSDLIIFFDIVFDWIHNYEGKSQRSES